MNNMKKEQLRLYAVTDRTWLGNETLYQQVEKALEGGATLVQLREKELPEADVQKEAEELLELCHRYGVKLILDDDVELAAKVGADGGSYRTVRYGTGRTRVRFSDRIKSLV